MNLVLEFLPEDGWGLKRRQVYLVQGLKFIQGTAGTPSSLQVATVGFLRRIREARTEKSRVVAAFSIPCSLTQMGVMGRCWREARGLQRREVTHIPFTLFKVQHGVQVPNRRGEEALSTPHHPSALPAPQITLRG